MGIIKFVGLNFGFLYKMSIMWNQEISNENLDMKDLEKTSFVLSYFGNYRLFSRYHLDIAKEFHQ